MRRLTLAPALAVAALVAVFAGAQGAGAQDPPKTPTARGTGGAAASVDRMGTQAAIDTLAHGGNAVDAAVAAAGVLGVVEPFSCGIGGGGFMVIRPQHGKVTTIDGREEAPAAMRPDSFLVDGKAPPFEQARFSGLSAGVPGTPATWDRALRKYGTTTLAQALAPGIRAATGGYTVDQTFYNQVDGVKTYFDDVPSTAALYLDPDGSPKDVGTRITNPDMAKTYRIMARKGTKKGFYRGDVADATAQAAAHPPVVNPDANHPWRPGLMTTSDLERYAAPEREPVASDYRGYTVYGMGPPSSGGTAVAEVLNILGGYDPAGSSKVEVYHRMLEASRYAFADRNAYLADPAYFDVPLEGLTSLSFAAERRALIGPNAATSPVAPGDPYDDQGDHKRKGRATATISHPRQSTTHLTVVDRNGMMVSYTFTIESIGGNAVTVPGYGFLLNNELTDFNYDDLTMKTANRPDGGKRPRSSMSPTVIEKDGQPFMAVGSPGGSTIIGTVLQILVNRLDLGYSLQGAIAAPRAVERNTATAQAEQAFIDSPEGQGLAALGHKFAPPAAPGEIGAATGIEVHGSELTAAAEPQRRGAGSAGVVTPSP